MCRALVAAALLAVPVAGATPPRVSKVRVGLEPYTVTAVGRSVWIALYGTGQVVRLDAGRARVTKGFNVGGGPAGVAVSGSTVWAGNHVGSSVARIDLRTAKVRHIRVGRKPIALGAGAGAVWVGDYTDGRVTKLDARSGRVLFRRSFRGEEHEGLAVARDGVWTVSENGIVQKLDPKTGETLATTQVGDDPDYVTVGGGSVWVSCYADSRLWRLDPATGKVLGTITIGEGAQGIAIERSLWVAKYTGDIVRIDPAAGQVAERFAVGGSLRAVAIASGSAWAASSAGRVLVRVRLR